MKDGLASARSAEGLSEQCACPRIRLGHVKFLLWTFQTSTRNRRQGALLNTPIQRGGSRTVCRSWSWTGDKINYESREVVLGDFFMGRIVSGPLSGIYRVYAMIGEDYIKGTSLAQCI